MFRQRSEETLETVTESYNHRRISHWSFHSSGGVQTLKKFQLNGREIRSLFLTYVKKWHIATHLKNLEE